MADLDFGKIKLYVGNYDFWKQSSELAARLQADRNAKAEEKIKELQEFVARFSANASKSKQATSRKKMLDKIELEEIVPSSRKYPFINFKAEREIGNDLLTVENLTVKMDGETILDNISFILRPGDKTAIIGQNDIQTTALIRALADDIDYEGTIKWGVTTSRSYLPKDNSKDFASGESILEWLRQFAEKGEDDDTFLRGFLGRMLFSGDEVNKSVSVLSGGLRIICVIFSLLLLPIRVPTQELCYLRVREIPLQTRSDRKVPHHFSRSFLPLLVSSDAAHRTYGRLRVLVPINDAIVHAHMVFHVR